jgi:hypothetical protein
MAKFVAKFRKERDYSDDKVYAPKSDAQKKKEKELRRMKRELRDQDYTAYPNKMR